MKYYSNRHRERVLRRSKHEFIGFVLFTLIVGLTLFVGSLWSL